MEILETVDAREHLLALARGLQSSNGPLASLRRRGRERFAEVGFPTLRDEEWRFTSIAPVTKVLWAPAPAVDLPDDAVAAVAIPGLDSFRLVFVNGRFSEKHSSLSGLPDGVWIGSLESALTKHGDLIKSHLGGYASMESHPFAALNGAFVRDGAFVLVHDDVVVPKPIELLFLTSGNGVAAYPRNLIVGGANSEFSLAESYSATSDDEYLTVGITEVVAGPNARIDHYKLTRDSSRAFHFGITEVHQQRDSLFSSHSLTFGGRIVRNDVGTVLCAEGCTAILNGLYVTSDNQLVDNHTRIDHAKPHCESHELYKGILGGNSRGVFNGRIIVRPDAQKTNSKQTNKNLLLSKEALINTNPQLEIFADDVKCTHGATIGQLDADSLFYLRSRGIGTEESRAILTFAFANDLLERIKLPALRDELERQLYANEALGVVKP